MRTGRTMFAVVVAVIATTAGSSTQGNKAPAIVGGPSDAVFADLTGVDRIRSDGYFSPPSACGKPGEESRYCGGTLFDPETGLTYEGVGPECSRISYASSGDYSFRTISTKCATYPPVPDVGQRRVWLDFGGNNSAAVCADSNLDNDNVAPSVTAPIPTGRKLNVCGANLVDDVRIEAPGMFKGTASTVTVYISLDAPPIANTTQFLLEFSSPAQVFDLGLSRQLVYSGTAVLWKMVVGKGGKLQKSSTPIGEYSMPFALTARKTPM